MADTEETRAEKEFERMLKALDTNKDRRLSRDEIINVLPVNEFMDAIIDLKIQNGYTVDHMPEYRPDGSLAGPMNIPQVAPPMSKVVDDFNVVDVETLATLYRPMALTRERTQEILEKMFKRGIEPVMASDLANQSEKYDITPLPRHQLRITAHDQREL